MGCLGAEHLQGAPQLLGGTRHDYQGWHKRGFLVLLPEGSFRFALHRKHTREFDEKTATSMRLPTCCFHRLHPVFCARNMGKTRIWPACFSFGNAPSKPVQFMLCSPQNRQLPSNWCVNKDERRTSENHLMTPRLSPCLP